MPRLISILLVTANFNVGVICFAASPRSETLIASSGSAHVSLIELYSSESCSSCPPADEWISKLQNKKGLWTEFVPVVFHVDYWNNLGWKDGFSSDQMTKRQIDLSKLWQTPQVYTPAFIVDGKEWREWRSSNQPGFQREPKDYKIELFIYSASDHSFRVKAKGLKNDKHYSLIIAKLGMGLSTAVNAGENSGHLLKHNFLILDWHKNSLLPKTSELVFKLKEDKAKSSKSAVAAWIEEEGNPTPIQATGGYL